MTDPTTEQNAIDHFDEVRYQLEAIEDLYARGEFARADASMFALKEKLNSLHNHVWLQHHRSGEGKV